jgi:hypothetical protein
VADSLLVIQKGARAGDEHPVDGEMILGREQGSADLVIDDPGVSRRHARVLADGGDVIVEDLGSSNGTFVAEAVDALPKTPIEVGVKREVGPDDRIYVGSWTRLVIRKAAPGEVT